MRCFYYPVGTLSSDRKLPIANLGIVVVSFDSCSFSIVDALFLNQSTKNRKRQIMLQSMTVKIHMSAGLEAQALAKRTT